jgi:hypothetical protein
VLSEGERPLAALVRTVRDGGAIDTIPEIAKDFSPQQADDLPTANALPRFVEHVCAIARLDVGFYRQLERFEFRQ